jgi:hypothetical protein
MSSVAHSLWTALDQCNTSLGQTLARLTELCERDQHAYVETVRWVSGLQPRQVRHQSLLTFAPKAVADLTRAVVACKPKYAARAIDMPRSFL